MPVPDVTATKSGLYFAVLLTRRESPRWGVRWAAVSVLTSNLAEARTEEGALDSLFRTIEAEIAFAGTLGLSPERWYATRPHAPRETVEAFCRLAGRGLTVREVALDGIGRAAAAGVATARDAA